MGKEILIVVGMGNHTPEKHNISDKETVGDLKRQFAKDLNVSSSEIEVSTEHKQLMNDDDKVVKFVNTGDTLYITPRGKGGM